MPAAPPAAAPHPPRRARLTTRPTRRHPRRVALLALALFGALGAAPAAAQSPANPVAVAIRAQAGGRLKAFYQPRGYWPLWIVDGAPGPQAGVLLKLLATADRDGLRPRDYRPAELERALDAARSGEPKLLARAELKLSEAFAAYVRDMRAGGADMTYLDRELVPERPRDDEVLRRAALPPSFADYVRTMGWMSPIYRQLRDALIRYDATWRGLPDIVVPDGPALKAGARGERVALLRQRLDLPAGSLFDQALATRLKAFQADHGLPTQGIAGAQTVAALNRGAGYYERLLGLNLERARALPGPWTRAVVVDAANARLWFYEEGKEVGTMKVVAGTAETPTPMLAGMVRYAILNPYWNVPADLVRSRIAPKVLGGASFTRLGYQALTDWSASAAPVDPKTIDWHAVAAGGEEVRVRQLPGGANAMGRVKFMFPNDQGIYLHDTPNRTLFAKPARHFSNGCIRLEDAPRLGRWLLGHPLAAAGGAPEQDVPLAKPVPVYLTYLTALPTAGGITFAEDAYGRDGGERVAER